MTAENPPSPRSAAAPWPAALPAQYLHDLRTPLHQIIGYAEMLAEQAEEEGQRGFVPDLEKIRAAGRQLLVLLNNGPEPMPEGTTLPASRNGSSSVRSSNMAVASATPSVLPPEGPPSAWELRPSAAPPVALLLVVDDNEMNRDVLSRRLRMQGHRVAVAENGRQAMESVRARDFDLVLLDILMPEMDGYAVLEQLKADETLRHIPVVMISALDELENTARCIEMGAEDYLPKPFVPTLLKARVGACLEKKRARDREVRLFEQLRQNYARLQELERQRDDLTQMIVHDLRTPLTSVITGMQTLDVLGDLNAGQREMMDLAIGGGETLLGMINDLLDVEKLECGAMELEHAPVSADELVAAAVLQVASLAESKTLSLDSSVAADLPPFQGDEDKLRRVLVNLLGNAIKFTPAGGAVTADVRPGADGHSLVFSVRDTGEGIPPEAFERIFEKFGQVESRQGGRNMSTGLGLTFCKMAVEAHGGHIGVESIPGEGSIFSFTIPLAPRDGA
ncbi:MAG TPA: response regulator [Armatimonadaceae bacterium]|nr:response regulator [Armatimonadaceae bacterium]